MQAGEAQIACARCGYQPASSARFCVRCGQPRVPASVAVEAHRDAVQHQSADPGVQPTPPGTATPGATVRRAALPLPDAGASTAPMQVHVDHRAASSRAYSASGNSSRGQPVIPAAPPQGQAPSAAAAAAAASAWGRSPAPPVSFPEVTADDRVPLTPRTIVATAVFTASPVISFLIITANGDQFLWGGIEYVFLMHTLPLLACCLVGLGLLPIRIPNTVISIAVVTLVTIVDLVARGSYGASDEAVPLRGFIAIVSVLLFSAWVIAARRSVLPHGLNVPALVIAVIEVLIPLPLNSFGALGAVLFWALWTGLAMAALRVSGSPQREAITARSSLRSPIPSETSASSPNTFSAARPSTSPVPQERRQPVDMGTRFGAWLIDGLVLSAAVIVLQLVFVLIFVLFLVLGVSSSLNSIGTANSVGASSTSTLPVVFNILSFVPALGFAVMVWILFIGGPSRLGQTIGKRTMGIQVIDKDTGRFLPWSRVLGRNLTLSLMGMPCYLGYISIFTDPSGWHRGWHDKAANSVVVLGPKVPFFRACRDVWAAGRGRGIVPGEGQNGL